MRAFLYSLMAAGALATLAPGASFGQAAPPPPPAKTGDVESVDAIIKALYDVISGPAGQVRDWDRFRSLFAPGARLIPTGRDQQGKGRIASIWSPEEYAAVAGKRLEESGFFEREIGRVEERFGNVVHAFSSYDSKRTLEDPKPFSRGINSIQMLTDGTRYYIVSIFWDSETGSNPIPAKYLNRAP
ncbi:MAG: hypothetical protein KF785_12120 [Gemmatimonadales bacterium]|nr:hypothetical protein [Gemmatimonadales bacterium]